MEQACKRGWMTYTDLAAVWENTDLQVSMLKHTAKVCYAAIACHVTCHVTYLLQVAFSGVTLYLVCVSTLLAALQPIALFSADSGPAHQLQQESLQPPPSVQAGHLVPTSQLVPAGVDAPPPPWQEVWPSNRSLLGEASISPHLLITTYDEPAFNHWQPYNSTPPGLAPNTAPPAAGFVPNMSLDSVLTSLLRTDLHNSASRREYVTPQDNSTSQPSNLLVTPPLFCSCVWSNSRESLAKVEMPQAQDLSYQHKGTFHWDPFINSSLSSDNETSVTGALTFIVRYLAPHWIA